MSPPAERGSFSAPAVSLLFVGLVYLWRTCRDAFGPGTRGIPSSRLLKAGPETYSRGGPRWRKPGLGGRRTGGDLSSHA